MRFDLWVRGELPCVPSWSPVWIYKCVCHAYEYVTYMNASCHIYECVMLCRVTQTDGWLIWMRHTCVTYMDGSYVNVYCCVMVWHIWMRDIWPRIVVSCHTYGWVTYVSASYMRDIYERIIYKCAVLRHGATWARHVWMRIVALLDTYGCVTSTNATCNAYGCVTHVISFVTSTSKYAKETFYVYTQKTYWLYCQRSFMETGFRPLCPSFAYFVPLSRTKPAFWISTRNPIWSEPGSMLVDGFDTRLIPSSFIYIYIYIYMYVIFIYMYIYIYIYI